MSKYYKILLPIVVALLIALFVFALFRPTAHAPNDGESVPITNTNTQDNRNTVDDVRTTQSETLETGVQTRNEVVEMEYPALDETALVMNGNSLTEVPRFVFGKTDTTYLDLSHNELGALPAEIGHLTALITLDLSHNKLTGIPAELGRLTELRSLNLSYNKLTGLPYELGNLTHLQTLDLRGNDYAHADLDIIKKGLSGTTILTD